MKKMKEFRDKTSEELKKLIQDNKIELLKMRSNYRVQAEAIKPHLFKAHRKANARAMTIISERGR
ncbi:MAG: 50S ribosomal protein L29 [Chlamydiia bacterium]